MGAHCPVGRAFLSTACPTLVAVQLLAALVRVALASEPMQHELNNRIEALAAARRGRDGKDGGGPGDEDSDVEADLQRLPQVAASGQATPSVSVQAGAATTGSEVPSRAGSEAPSASAAAARSAEQQQSGELPARAVSAADWAAWLQQRRLGLRRPLGLDLRGRRYWCFGRQAGAFRVYVEDSEGQAWGWYEGKLPEAFDVNFGVHNAPMPSAAVGMATSWTYGLAAQS